MDKKLTPGNTLVIVLKNKHPFKLYGNKKTLSTDKCESTISLTEFHMDLKRRFKKSIPDAINFLDYHYEKLILGGRHKFLEFMEHYVIKSQCDSDNRNIDLRPFKSPLKTWVKKKKRNIKMLKITAALSVLLIISFAIFPSTRNLLTQTRQNLFWIVLPLAFDFLSRRTIKHLKH